MAEKKKNLEKVWITNSYGIGYASGRMYEVEPAEAKSLYENKNAIPYDEHLKTVETAKAELSKVEKRKMKERRSHTLAGSGAKKESK